VQVCVAAVGWDHGYMSVGVIATNYKVRANIEEIKSWNISYFLIGIFCVQ